MTSRRLPGPPAELKEAARGSREPRAHLSVARRDAPDECGPGENGPFGARRRRDGDADALVAGALVALAAFAVDLRASAAARLARERRARRRRRRASLTAETRNPQAGDPARSCAAEPRNVARVFASGDVLDLLADARDRSA